MQASRLTAIGGVLLAAAIVMIQVRLEDSWGHGPHLLLALAGAAGLLGLALAQHPDAGPRPTAEQSTLLVAGLATLLAAVVRFGQVAGENHPVNHSGTVILMSLIFGAIAAYPAVRYGSSICTLAAAIAFGIAFIEICHNLFDANRPNTFRWLFLVTIAAYAVGSLALRVKWPRHAAQLVNAAMIASVAIPGTILFGIPLGDEGASSALKLPTLWEMVALAVPLLGIGYALVTRERGPAWSGAAALLVSVLVIGEPKTVLFSTHGSLAGWPLVLLIASVACFAGGFARLRHT